MESQLPDSVLSPVEPPRGLFPGKLDDKGRLKLPAAFLKYFKDLEAEKLFVTSIDGATAQIYTIPTWRVNEKLLATNRENKAVAKKVALIANWLGGDSEIDGQGRVLFNTVIRKELKLDGQGLHLQVVNEGRIDVMTDERFEALRREALQSSQADIEAMEMAGLQ